MRECRQAHSAILACWGCPAAAQINLFTGEVEPPVVMVEPEDHASEEISVDEGISLIKTEEGSQLILSGFGLFLSKKSERLVVRKSNQVLYQFPFFRLSEVVVGGKGIGISSDLLGEIDKLDKLNKSLTNISASISRRHDCITKCLEKRIGNIRRILVSGFP